ncbi:hypothetical protein [Clostridium sp.]|uniref:hypothetical protein n=1 Tax=Clostridium sp. TaxID=1506 RepID=UPI003F2DA19D
MKKDVGKLIVGIGAVCLAIYIGGFILWIASSIVVVAYIFKEKKKYIGISGFYKDIKNVLAIIAAIVLLIVVPINFIKSSIEYSKRVLEQQKQEFILEGEGSEEEKRASVLDAKSKFEKDIKDGKDIKSSGILTNDQIERYTISEDEIIKYNSEREVKEKEQYEKLARKYVKENIESTPKNFIGTKSAYNEDKTKLTVKGRYTGKNQYGVSIRGSYELEYDLSTEEVINLNIGKEKVE